MGKFRRQMARQHQPSKNDIIEQYDKRLKALSNAIQQVVMLNNRQIEAISARVNEIGNQTDVADYRSLATMEMLNEKGILTTDAHDVYVTALKIKNFEEASAKDDAERKLIQVDRPSKLGDFVSVGIKAFYPDTIEIPAVKDVTLTGIDGSKSDEPASTPQETIPHPQAGQQVDELTILRSKIQLGTSQFFPLLENELIGLARGEHKEFSLLLPKEFKKLAGQTVNFKVEVFDVREEPPKSATAPAPAPAA